ncbi:MAG: glycosyltransferase involved in cell wall biosynthesis [Cyclobacteriaceae bacterium]
MIVLENKKLIIGMILDNDFPPDPRVENEAQVLINAGFQVNLFAFSYSKEFTERETYKGIEVYRYFCGKLLYKLSALAYTIPLYHYFLRKPISKFIKETKCNTLHIHDIQVARAVFLLQSKLKFKVVLDLHENRPEIMKFYKHVKSFPWKYLINPKNWKQYEEEYVKRSNGVVVVTSHAKKEVIRRTGVSEMKIVVAPNVVSQKYELNQPIDSTIVEKYKDNFVLLYLGDTSERRGLNVAIKSVPEICLYIENLKLVIVGSSSYDDNLKVLAEKLGVSDYIDFLGWKNFNLFPSFIKASNICISPLEKNIHHDTTYANKLFQYMALGGILLVSDCDAQEDLINETETGLVFKNQSVDDFTNKVLKLFNNKSLRNKYSKNGIKAVSQKYNWEKAGQELVDFYKDLSVSNYE